MVAANDCFEGHPMNPRVTTIIIGLLTLAFGLAGLLYPDRVMGLLGFTVLNASHAAAAYGEIRAMYGGLFTVIGVFTLLAGIDPAAHRARILFVGLLYFGLCGGRLVGTYVDGNPGVPGWLAVALELTLGSALVAASWAARPVVAQPSFSRPSAPPPAPPVAAPSPVAAPPASGTPPPAA